MIEIEIDLAKFLSTFFVLLIGYYIGYFVRNWEKKEGFPKYQNPPPLPPPTTKIGINKVDVQEYMCWISATYMQGIIDEIGDWSEKTFPKQTSVGKLHHLLEEVGELIEECEREPGFMATSLNKNLEFADCFILLLDAARKEGLSSDDILVTISHKMEINKKRKWGLPDENSVVKHIKEETK
jgi:NTP pyrophosphatase (non-canonical NTP hydrolase)